MPGFRPNKHYIREMKRFGILPADLGLDDPIDVYKTDERYWRSFWYTKRRISSTALSEESGISGGYLPTGP